VIWALAGEERIRANPNTRARCPSCNAETIPKCGEINIWHWAHKSTAECDPWHENETLWHINWKERFPDKWQEVPLGPHRADIQTPQNIVIEFQRSPISTIQIKEREAFYGDMLWILNGADFTSNFEVRDSSRYAKKLCSCGLKLGLEDLDYGYCPNCGTSKFIQNQSLTRPYWTFRWKHPRKSWFVATRPIGIDSEGMIFWIKKLYGDSNCAGWGIYQQKSDFINGLITPKT
jgi:competence CoiA-like predicted nuclease